MIILTTMFLKSNLNNIKRVSTYHSIRVKSENNLSYLFSKLRDRQSIHNLLRTQETASD